ncbi:LOW QUALITY PROTEIN: hypothetical protein V2J09_009067 [Rumex salicifolius]
MHICNEERRNVMKEVIRNNLDVFVGVEYTLKTLKQWLCYDCMSIQAWSRACKHEVSVEVRPTLCEVVGGVREVIIGVPRPCPQVDLFHLEIDFELNMETLDAVFKALVCTVKSIPRRCRLAFSHALKAALLKVVAEPRSVTQWVKLLLLPCSTLRVYRPKGRKERRFGNRKASQQKLILHALAIWGEDGGVTKLVREVLKKPKSLGKDFDKDADKEGVNRLDTNVTTCLRKLEDGHFTAVVKAINSSGAAPNNVDTRKTLEGKHPVTSPPEKPTIPLQESPLVAEEGTILSCIKSFPKGTLCGRDGCGHNTFSMPFLGKVQLSLLISKTAMKGVGKDMATYLQDFQFGVGVSGGAEAILHVVNRFVNKHHGDHSFTMLTNNHATRGEEKMSIYITMDGIPIWPIYKIICWRLSHLFDYRSSTGRPLGPLLFSLVLHQLVTKINEQCALSLLSWYFDDGTVIGDTVEKLSAGMFSVETSRPDRGVKLLGGVVSLDFEFVEGLAIKRVEKAVELMHILSKLRDPQSELLLLRSCMGIAKLPFGLHTCQPEWIREAIEIFDMGLRENIVVYGGSFFGDLQWRLSSLPIRYVGFGLYSASEASQYAFIASRVQSWDLQDHILRDNGVTLPDFDFSSFNNKNIAPPKSQNALASALFVYCKVNLGFKQRHDYVPDTLYDGRSTLRPADVLIFGWVKGKHACVDFTRASPLAGIWYGTFTVGQAALRAASGMVSKHDKACRDNGHAFIPFAFDTFGFLAPKVVGLLKRV